MREGIGVVSLCAFLLLCGSAARTEEVPARAPVIYVHGMNDVADDYTKRFDLPALFKTLDYPLKVAATPRYGTIEQRAEVLASEIDRLVPEGPYHLLGHSMGGLDSRLMIRQSPTGARCLSLTTLATPHHGALLADAVMSLADGALGLLLEPFRIAFSSQLDATRELTTDYLTRVFNPEVLDNPNVRYFSVGFTIPAPVRKHSKIPFARLMHWITGGAKHEPNDGLVTVRSAEWGRSLGVLTSDHWSETHPGRFRGGNSLEEIYGLVLRNLSQEFDNR